MVKRKVRKTKTRKMKTRKTSRKTKKPAKKARSTRTKKKMGAKSQDIKMNKKAHWEAYKHLQKRCDQAWNKLKADVKRKAAPEILIRDKNQLLLLLGECNYMARECMRFSARKKY